MFHIFNIKGLLTFLIFFVLTSQSSYGITIDVEIPGQVDVGDPFEVVISSKNSFKTPSIIWDKRKVSPSVTKKKNLFISRVILGVSLNKKKGIYPIKVEIKCEGNVHKVSENIIVTDRKFEKERLKVAPRHIKPPQKVMKRIREERKKSLEALNTISSVRFWKHPFKRPVRGKMLSRFGARRVFNGETKRRHKGLDFRAWKGTPIRSMAKGRIILTGHFYFAGKCVFIDHGNGLISLSCHMSKLLVKEGDFVKAGQKIGLSGATGRVTGAHLHLSVYALGKSINPEAFFDGTI